MSLFKSFIIGTILTMAIAPHASAFDLEDYATTYRATRDAYLKAGNERKLAQGPQSSAAKAWIDVEMTEQLSKGNTEAVELLIKLKKKMEKCSL